MKRNHFKIFALVGLLVLCGQNWYHNGFLAVICALGAMGWGIVCYAALYPSEERKVNMDTVLVDVRKFMKVCDELVGEVHWKDMAYLLYEKGFSIAEVHALSFVYVYPFPQSDEEWKMYQPIPVIFPAVYRFQQIFNVDITTEDEE